MSARLTNTGRALSEWSAWTTHAVDPWGLSIETGAAILTDTLRELAQNPPLTGPRVRAAAQVAMYGRVISPKGPAAAAQIAESAGLKSPTIYAQAEGGNAVSLQAIMGLALAGDPAGACRVLAGLLFGLATLYPDQVRALLQLAAGLVGEELTPSSRLATDAAILDVVADCGETGGEIGQAIVRIIRDRNVDADEKEELRTKIPAWIRVLQLALGKLEAS